MIMFKFGESYRRLHIFKHWLTTIYNILHKKPETALHFMCDIILRRLFGWENWFQYDWSQLAWLRRWLYFSIVYFARKQNRETVWKENIIKTPLSWFWLINVFEKKRGRGRMKLIFCIKRVTPTQLTLSLTDWFKTLNLPDSLSNEKKKVEERGKFFFAPLKLTLRTHQHMQSAHDLHFVFQL